MNGEALVMNETQGEVQHQWAVICTGFIDREYNVTPFEDSKKNRCPVVIRLFPDRPTADKMLKRLQARHAKVNDFLTGNWQTTIPIYGIAETDLPITKKRQGNPNAFGRGANAGNNVPATGGRGRKKAG